VNQSIYFTVLNIRAVFINGRNTPTAVVSQSKLAYVW